MIAIVSCGPSLNETLPVYLNQDYDFTIAVNKAVEAVHATHYAVRDWKSLVNWKFKNPNLTLGVRPSLVPSALSVHPEADFLRELSQVDVGKLGGVPRSLLQCSTSGPYALILAIELATAHGLQSIDCYGCDMGGTGHFKITDSDDDPRGFGCNRKAKRWARERKHWANLTRFAASAGMTVTRIRASPSSRSSQKTTPTQPALHG